MPIYEYHCKNCNNTFEEWLKVSDAEKSQPCPQCSQQADRFVSQTSFVLKGGGWYVTEYGKNSASSSHNAPTSSKQNSDTATASADSSSSTKESGSSSSTSESSTSSSTAQTTPTASSQASSSTKADS